MLRCVFVVLSATVFGVVRGIDVQSVQSVGQVDLSVSDSLYSSRIVIPCQDDLSAVPLADDPHALLTRVWRFNNGSLRANAYARYVDNSETKNRNYNLYLELPTVEDDGEYDCCVQAATPQNTNTTGYRCFRTRLAVHEFFHYTVVNQKSVAVSINRNLMLTLMDGNPASIKCTMNGNGTLPDNVRTLYKEESTMKSTHPVTQLAIVGATEANLGTYNCTLYTDTGATSHTFELTKATSRWYPWSGEPLPTVPPTTDPEGKEDNAAPSLSLSTLTLLLTFAAGTLTWRL